MSAFEENKQFECPHCGVINALSVDLTAGDHQAFVVDCEVCCAPITVKFFMRSVVYEKKGRASALPFFILGWSYYEDFVSCLMITIR
jgi:Cysteine-rich CPXCG